jgi:hypothetical protein
VVCCSYLSISALDKKGFEHCRHCALADPIQENVLQLTGVSNNGNCRIHDQKPQVCKAYNCLWVHGHGDDDDRPDKSKLLIDRLHQIEGAIEVKQLVDGVAYTPRGMKIIKRMARSTNCIALVASMYETKLERAIGRPPD